MEQSMIKCTKNDLAVALTYGYYKSALSMEDFKSILSDKIETFELNKRLKHMVCEHISNTLKPPVAVLCSGGVDSTFMMCMARNCFMDKDLFPVTVKFDNKKYCEYDKAHWVLCSMGFKGQHYAVPCPDFNEVLHGFSKVNYNNLFFSSSIVPTYGAMQGAASLAENVLTGDGGDELFGGYDRYLWTYFCSKHPNIAGIISNRLI